MSDIAASKHAFISDTGCFISDKDVWYTDGAAILGGWAKGVICVMTTAIAPACPGTIDRYMSDVSHRYMSDVSASGLSSRENASRRDASVGTAFLRADRTGPAQTHTKTNLETAIANQHGHAARKSITARPPFKPDKEQ